MATTGKRIVTAALCTLLTASPILGTVSKAHAAENADAKREGALQEIGEESSEGKKIPYSRQGTYTVTLAEGDFRPFEKDETADDAKKQEEKAAAEAAKKQEEQAAADAKALEDAKAALEGAKSARDEAQRAADEAKAAEEKTKAEADEAEKAKTEAEAKRDEAEQKAKAEAEQKAEADMADAETTGDDAAKAAQEAAEAAAKAAQEKAEAAGKAAEARAQAEDALAKAEEAAKAAEQRVSELEGKKVEADAQQKENKAEEKKDEGKDNKKALAFSDVKLEDVKVYYLMLTNQAELEADASGKVEPKYEEREAKVNALANGSGAITLSFTDPDAASNATDCYEVEIESLGKFAPVVAESVRPQLSAESNVKADSESCDVTIKAEGARFAAGLGAGDLKLGGSFADMQITGAEVSGDKLTVHLSGRPKMDYDVASVVTDGQITIPASGFENSAAGAMALVDVKLSDEAYDVGDEELPTAITSGEAESSSVEGNTGRATVYLDAELGDFKDVKPESIALGDTFSGGKVESVTKEGERLKVDLTFPVDGEQVGDRVLAGTVKLAAGAMEDESGKAATEVETLVALAPAKAGDKKSEEDKKKEEEAKKKKEEEKKKKEENSKTLKTYSDGFKYASDKLKKVDPTVAELAKFYGEAFNLASNVAGGKYLDALKNVESLLQICGVIEPEAKEVTAADVLDEVKALRMVVEAVDRKIDENTEESRADRYTKTAIRLARIRARCKTVGTMFQEGAKVLANRKDNPMKPPAKGASKEQLIKYNAELRRVILQEGAKTNVGKDKDDAPTFLDAKNTMVKLNEELFTVANWVAIDKNAPNSSANPINVFDKLVASKFNWDSQGYYARQAFRTELKCTMLSAFSYLAIFYNYSVPLMDKAQRPLIDSVAEALKQIDARPAGISPEQVRENNGKNKAFKVYSPTLGITIKKSYRVSGGRGYATWVEDVPESKTTNYYVRAGMRGGQYNDLQLAGLEEQKDGQKFDGIGLNFVEKWDLRWMRGRRSSGSTGWRTRKAWTTILFKNKPMAEKVQTSDEQWRLESKNGKKTEKKVKDKQMYTFYWFDRARN